MRRQETAEGRSVRLLRVGEQVRHILSELLQRGDTVGVFHKKKIAIGSRIAPPRPSDRARGLPKLNGIPESDSMSVFCAAAGSATKAMMKMNLRMRRG